MGLRRPDRRHGGGRVRGDAPLPHDARGVVDLDPRGRCRQHARLRHRRPATDDGDVDAGKTGVSAVDVRNCPRRGRVLAHAGVGALRGRAGATSRDGHRGVRGPRRGLRRSPGPHAEVLKSAPAESREAPDIALRCWRSRLNSGRCLDLSAGKLPDKDAQNIRTACRRLDE